MTSFEDQVAIKVRKFNELEKEFITITYESKKPETKEELENFYMGAFRISSRAFKLRNEIATDFSDVLNIKIYDKEVRETLDKMRRNDKFYSIAFYESLAESWNLKAESHEEEMDASLEDYLYSYSKFDELLEEFHSWFSISAYYYKKIKIGPILSSSHVPESIKSYFGEIRNAYAFGLYKSSIALCRALLEMSLFDKLKKKGAFKEVKTKVTHIDSAKEDNLYRYIFLAKQKRVLNKINVDKAHQVRISANKILHIKDKEAKIKEKEAFDIILNTVEVIESLYR